MNQNVFAAAATAKAKKRYTKPKKPTGDVGADVLGAQPVAPERHAPLPQTGEGERRFFGAVAKSAPSLVRGFTPEIKQEIAQDAGTLPLEARRGLTERTPEMPDYVRRNILKRTAASTVPAYLQDPKNWPDEFKRDLLDPESVNAKMAAYDQDKYGMPVFDYLSDPDRDRYRKQVTLAKEPGNIFSEAKAMDERLRELGMNPSAEQRHDLIGVMWLRNGMKSDTDPVAPGSGKDTADLFANTDADHLHELVEQGRARRFSSSLYSGQRPAPQDVESASRLASYSPVTGTEAARLMGPGKDTGLVNLPSGGTANLDPQEDFYRWLSGEGPMNVSRETALSGFRRAFGVGTYENEMGLTPVDERKLASASGLVDARGPTDVQSVMREAGEDPHSFASTIARDEPDIASADPFGLYARAFRAVLPSALSTTLRQATGTSYTELGEKGKVSESALNAIGGLIEAVSLGNAGSAIAGAKAGMTAAEVAEAARTASLIQKGGKFFTGYVAQQLPSVAVALQQNKYDVGKTVAQTAEGMAKGFSPGTLFDPNVPVPEKVAAGINQAFLLLGVSVHGLQKIADVRSKVPTDVSPAAYASELAAMPPEIAQHVERVRQEVLNGLIEANGHSLENAHPALKAGIDRQAQSVAITLARAAAHIEANGGQDAATSLRNVRYEPVKGLELPPEYESLIQSAPQTVENPPAPPGPQKTEGGVTLGPTYFWTPNLGRQEAVYEIVPLDSLKASHDSATFEENPNYPSELQPRDRTREANRTSVADIARKFDHERALDEHRSMLDGAPIVMPDGTVVSGNGRVMALQSLARGEGNQAGWQKYRFRLKGMGGADVAGMKDPVLVRRVPQLETADARLLAEEGNRGSASAMSPVEEARSDAGRLSETFWQSLEQSGNSIDSALNSRKNRGLVTRFLQSLPEAERGRLVTRDGALSVEGLLRIKRAAVLDLLGEDGVYNAERMFETGEESARLSTGFFRAVPDLLKVKSPELADALNTVFTEFDRFRTFQDEGKGNWETYKAQSSMTPLDPEVKAMVDQIGDAVTSRGSAAKVADAFTALASEGKFKDIAARLAGQETLWSGERGKGGYVVARLMVPSWKETVLNHGAKDLGDGYFAVPDDPNGHMLLDQAGMQVDRVRTRSFAQRNVGQEGLFGEPATNSISEKIKPEEGQETLFAGLKEGETYTVNAVHTWKPALRTGLVRLGPGATVAEVAHETAHYIRRILPDTTLRAVEESLGIKDWDLAAEERFARAFELYLTEKGSNPGLDPVMARLAMAVRDVYGSTKGERGVRSYVKKQTGRTPTPEDVLKFHAEPTIGEGGLTVPDSLKGIFDDMTKRPESWPGMTAAIAAKEKEESAVPEQKPAEGVLRQERPEVGLPEVVEGDAGRQEPAGKETAAPVHEAEVAEPSPFGEDLPHERPIAEIEAKAKSHFEGKGMPPDLAEKAARGVYGDDDARRALMGDQETLDALGKAFGKSNGISSGLAHSLLELIGEMTAKREGFKWDNPRAPKEEAPPSPPPKPTTEELASGERRLPGLKNEDLDADIAEVLTPEDQASPGWRGAVQRLKDFKHDLGTSAARSMTGIVSELSRHEGPGRDAADKINNAWIFGRQLSAEYRYRIYDAIKEIYGRSAKKKADEIADTERAVLERWDSDERLKVLSMDPGAFDDWLKLAGRPKPAAEGLEPPTLRQIKLWHAWGETVEETAKTAWSNGVGVWRVAGPDIAAIDKALQGREVRFVVGGSKDTPGVMQAGKWVGWDVDKGQGLVLGEDGKLHTVDTGDVFTTSSLLKGQEFFPKVLTESARDALSDPKSALYKAELARRMKAGATKEQAQKLIAASVEPVTVNVPGRVLTRIERPRLPNDFPPEFYEHDFKRMAERHLDSVGKRVAQAQFMGPDMADVAKDLAEASGGDQKLLRHWAESVQSAFGHGTLSDPKAKAARDAASAYGAFKALTALGTGKTALKQWSSLASTAGIHGFTATARSLVSTLNPSWWDTVHRLGPLDSDYAPLHFMDFSGAAKETASKVLKWTGVTLIDQALRVNAALAGIIGAKQAVMRLARIPEGSWEGSRHYRYLHDWGKFSAEEIGQMVDRARASGGRFDFTMDGMRPLFTKAAFSGVQTQGITDPVNYPRWVMQNPTVKGMMTLNNFYYLQSKVFGHAMNELARGNPDVLLKMTVAGTLLGSAVMAGVAKLEKQKQVGFWYAWYRSQGENNDDAIDKAMTAAGARGERPGFKYVTDIDWKDWQSGGTAKQIAASVADGMDVSGLLGMYGGALDAARPDDQPFDRSVSDRIQSALTGVAPVPFKDVMAGPAQFGAATEAQKQREDQELKGAKPPAEEKPGFWEDVFKGTVEQVAPVPLLGGGAYRKPSAWKLAFDTLSDENATLARRYGAYPQPRQRQKETMDDFMQRVKVSAEDWNLRLNGIRNSGLKGDELRGAVLRSAQEAFRSASRKYTK